MPSATDFVALKDIATSIGMDRSAALRYLKRGGYRLQKMRLPGTRGQQVVAVDTTTASAVIARRRAEGFSSRCPAASPPPTSATPPPAPSQPAHAGLPLQLQLIAFEHNGEPLPPSICEAIAANTIAQIASYRRG